MHLEILTDNQKQLLPIIKSFKKDFYLAGGTAIALHIGHRESIDFSMFTFNEFENFKLRQKIKKLITIDRVLRDELGDLTFLSLGVQITFFNYPYRIESELEFEDYFRVPDLLTLGAMKLFALGRRAKWKDYVDLYFILQRYSLSGILEKAETIFTDEFNAKILREQLSYFNDINYSEEVIFKKDFEVDDEEVKRKLIEHSLSE